MVDINIEDVTNSSNTGIFDKLMSSVNKNIEEQFLEGRITTAEYATVYLGSLQAVLAQSVQYNLQEAITEAQIVGIESDNLLKARQIVLVNEQIKNAYTERVVKDKQAAKLGLDNVMKLSEEERVFTPSYVYTPKYQE